MNENDLQFTTITEGGTEAYDSTVPLKDIYVEYKTKYWQALLFIIVYLLIVSWVDVIIIRPLIDSSIIFFLIVLVQSIIGYVVINSRFFKIKYEYDVEINEGTRQVKILDYNR